MGTAALIQKQTSVKFQRLFIIMAAIMMALVTFTACDKDDNGKDDPDDNGNNGGVAGKRFKEWVQTSPTGTTRSVYTYNSNGSIKQVDLYSGSVRITYNVYTNHPDGRPASIETFYEGNDMQGMKGKTEFTYDSNKTLQKYEAAISMGGVEMSRLSIDYTFQNGRKTREVQISSGGAAQMERVYEYDSQGKRTKTTETMSAGGVINQTIIWNRSYHSDGTLDKVTNNAGVTVTFTWENGNKVMDEDIFYAY
jgi:hypothetical protein